MEKNNKEKQEMELNQNQNIVEINNNENHEEVIEETIETIEQEEDVKEKNIKEEDYLKTNQEEDIAKTKNKGNNSEAEQEENNQTKCIKLWLLIIPLVLVILVLVYIFTDLLKTDEQNFAKYMYITSKNIEKLKTEELEKYFDKAKYTSEGEIILTAEGEKAKVEFDGKTDIENRLKETNIATDYSGKELVVNYKQDNDTYAIKIDKLYNKYIAIENRNLKELANLLEIDSENIPNKINLEKYKFTEEELKDIKQRYLKIIKEEINKENYSKEKSKEYNIYKLTLTNEQLNNIKIKSLQELKNDNLIIDKYVIYEEINGNKIEKEDLQKEIESKVEELEKNTSEQEKEALVISLYTKLNKCEKIEIKLFEEKILIELYSNSLKISNQQEDDNWKFEIQKEELEKVLKYNIQAEDKIYNFSIDLIYSDLSKDTVKEEYKFDLSTDSEVIEFKYINTTSQNNELVIDNLEYSECEILNALNREKINELIYKIYNNMINL